MSSNEFPKPVVGGIAIENAGKFEKGVLAELYIRSISGEKLLPVVGT
jgi:hypothetical protein